MPDDDEDGLPRVSAEVGATITTASLPVGRIRYRTGLAATWAAQNPVLDLFEAGVETDALPYAWKVGNGVDVYADLPYQAHELVGVEQLRMAFAGVDAVDDALAGIASAYDVYLAAGGDPIPVEDWLFTHIGPEGPQGARGVQGPMAGALTWAYEAGADNEPGQAAGIVRFDNPLDMPNISNMYLSTTSDEGNAFPWLNRISDLGGLGVFSVFAESDTSAFAVLNVTNIAQADGDLWQFEVSCLLNGETPFSDGDYLTIGYQPDGRQGITGDVGAPGNNATPPGVLLMLDLSSHADSDPGAGNLRTNHATFGSITKLYVDDVDQLNANLVAWLTAIGAVDNPVKGQLLVTSADTSTPGVSVFDVTAVTDAAGYTKVDVTPLVNGAIPDGTVVALTFSRSGDAA